jgi:hypothetical protein
MPFLKQLRRPEGPALKRIAGHQFYLQHPDFKQKVLDEYNANHAGTPKNKRLMVQCQIARALLEEESEEVKTRIRQEAAAEHEALLDAHNNDLMGLPSVDEEDRKK